MEFDLLEKLGNIAGIAGIAVGTFALIFGGIIKKNIFPQMDQKQGFRIIRIIIIAATIVAISGLVARYYFNKQQKEQNFRSTQKTIKVEGFVFDENQNPLAAVSVEVEDNETTSDVTDNDGKYSLRLKGNKMQTFDLLFKRKYYRGFRKEIELNFANSEKFKVDDIMLTSKEVEIIDEKPSRKANNKTLNTEHNQTTTHQNLTNITLIYSGDDYGCALDIYITVGGRTINPTGNTVYLNNVPLGNQNYSITGVINCGTYGYCTASGQDYLEITQGGIYYIMWMNDDLDSFCDIGLLTQEEYNLNYGY